MGGVVAIIPSAGRGLRMGSEIEKPYIRIHDKPILAHTLAVFETCTEVEGIWVVVEPERVEEYRRHIVDVFGFTRVMAVIGGGATRQESVFRGVLALYPEPDIVVVHDGARPLVRAEIIRESIRRCRLTGAALAAVPVKDTVKIVRSGVVESTPERAVVFLAQTPQTFAYALLKKAHERAVEDGYTGTDDTSLVERLGYPVSVVPGDYENIKITTPEDLEVAEGILSRRSSSGR
ncbi:MAG: 2-C-methyl-D-erythritol 4-phosphate cytidylyltransferase [candidate division Zixibacteria bacterium]|nr:2-C-methyl-D-erythritol 4-phosphate cytidylyltransferase [candidate division Zixibacteria bacterium]